MAVRTESGDILTETKRLKSKRWYSHVPLLRGVVAFVKSLISGTGVLLKSAEVIYPEDDTPSTGSFAVATALGLVLAIALFMLLPSFLADMVEKLIGACGVDISKVSLWILWKSLIEGVIRIVIFVLYLFIVSRVKDIRRTFMYHGAEHRTINCFERGFELTPENVQKCSTKHNRCGTTFLFFVMVVSILVFSLATWILSILGWDNIGVFGRMGVRLLLLPLVAGLSYELLRFLAKLPDNKFTNVLRAPGLALQRLTTYPPETDMAEVAIVSFNLVREMDEDQSIQPHKFGEFTMPELKRLVKTRLTKAGVTEDAEVDWLIAAALRRKRGELSSIEKTTLADYRRVAELVDKRVKGIPLDYIIKRSDFYGIKLYVDENVLVPRLDTEIVADEVIKYLNKNNGGEGKSVLDLMTGSGCIARAVAENTKSAVTASDISDSALGVAKRNLEPVHAEVIKSDGFSALTGRTFDVIVSNPPYIRHAEIETLQLEVKCQPMLALDGGEDGLDFYRTIAGEASAFLNDGGVLFLEIGYDQREDVTKLLEKDFENIVCVKDYGGNDRVIIAEKKTTENVL